MVRLKLRSIVEYCHLKPGAHTIVFVQGDPCEICLDCGDGDDFVNGSESLGKPGRRPLRRTGER